MFLIEFGSILCKKPQFIEYINNPSCAKVLRIDTKQQIANQKKLTSTKAENILQKIFGELGVKVKK